MRIMALDLGHNNCRTAVCVFDTNTVEHKVRWVKTSPMNLSSFVSKVKPDRIVMEACPVASWVYDLLVSLDVCEVQVAATNGEAWCWRNTKKKTDKMDALKLARLSAVGNISVVHMPSRATRQWRSLIRKRSKLVGKRTSVKNSIHSILTREGVVFDFKGENWSRKHLELLREQAVDLDDVTGQELWRGMLWVELEALEDAERLVALVEAKLDEIASADPRVQMLKDSEKGIGPRFAEMAVAMIDDPLRFPNQRCVGSYFGLVPRLYQSGQMLREGRIHKQGDKLMRTLAVEISWISLRWNEWSRDLYQKVRKGSPKRNKTAIVAVARRMMVRCWARLRDFEVERQNLNLQ